MIIEIDTATFKLGEKVYTVPALGLAQSEVWRQKFQDEVIGLLAVLRQQGALEKIDLAGFKDILKADLMDLLPVLSELFVRVNGAMSSLLGLICLYGSELAADQAEIERRATMKQAIVALREMVKLEYPFGALLPAKEPAKESPGQPEPTTGKN